MFGAGSASGFAGAVLQEGACEERMGLQNTQLKLASEEMRNPDPSTLIASVLDTTATRAEKSYRNSLQGFLEAETTGRTVAWKMERDRIY